MVTKKKNTSAKEANKSRVKVGSLKLKKETIKDLTAKDRKQVKGGGDRDKLCTLISRETAQ